MFIEDNDGLQIRLHLFKFSQRVLCVIQKRLDPQHTISQRNTKWAADMPPPHFSSIQSLSRVKLFGLQQLWTAAHQASLYLTKFRSLLKLMSMESVMLSNHLILCHPLLLPPSPGVWTVACQASLSMGFSRQEYWSGLSFPSSRDLPNPGIKPRSPALQADSLPTELQGKPPNDICPGSSYHFLVKQTDQRKANCVSIFYTA